ncbi:MAG: CPBP family intramembrane glutamic endopeptidase [Parachlamydiales bacterium]|jgi:hypothetical protein
MTTQTANIPQKSLFDKINAIPKKIKAGVEEKVSNIVSHLLNNELKDYLVLITFPALMYNYPEAISEGFSTWAARVTTVIALTKLGILPGPNPNDAYSQETEKISLTETTFVAPIIEEAIFRVGIQNCLSIFGNNFSLVGSSLLFGAGHLLNDHNGRFLQAILATWGGFVLGKTYIQSGFLASVALHSMNNMLSFLPSKLEALTSKKEDDVFYDVIDNQSNENEDVFYDVALS